MGPVKGRSQSHLLKLRKVGGAASIYFSSQWRIGLGEDWLFSHADVLSSQPPASQWIARRDDLPDPAVSICHVPQVLVVANADMMNGRYARAENFNGKPKYRQVGGFGILYFDDVWKMKRAEMSEPSYYSEEESPVPPTNHWTSQGGEEATVSLIHVPISTSPRFFWVQGAGGVGEAVNGCYACNGSSNGKPKYWQLDGAGIIYFRGHWRINYRDQEGGC